MRWDYRPSIKRVFAWFPIYASDTKQTVWLEHLYKAKRPWRHPTSGYNVEHFVDYSHARLFITDYLIYEEREGR